jgi:hypothetical protein
MIETTERITPEQQKIRSALSDIGKQITPEGKIDLFEERFSRVLDKITGYVMEEKKGNRMKRSAWCREEVTRWRKNTQLTWAPVSYTHLTLPTM